MSVNPFTFEWERLHVPVPKQNGTALGYDEGMTGNTRKKTMNAGKKWFTSTSLPKNAMEWGAPVHAEGVNTIDIDRLKLMAALTPYAERFAELVRLLEDVEVYKSLTAGEMMKEKQSVDLPRLYDLLLKSGIAEPMPEGETPLRIGRIFVVYEAKHRLRVIFWPRQLNDEMDNAVSSDIDLKTAYDHAAEVRNGAWSVCFDLKAGFFQLPFKESVRNYYVFVGPDGKYYRMTRLVMGGVRSAELCDLTMKILSYAPDINVTTTTHIDNVRFIGERNEVERMREHFIRNCAFVGATLNVEAENEPHQVGDFVGMTCNYAQGTVTLTEKSRNKIRSKMCWLEKEKISAAECASLFGSLLWGAQITGFPISEAYFAMKFMRRLLSNVAKDLIDPNEPVTLWPVARAEFSRWFKAVIEAEPRVPPAYTDASEMILFTDASLKGWGCVAVCTTTNRMWSYGDKWNDGLWAVPPHINHLEGIAAGLAFMHFKELLRDKHVRLVVDNTSIRGTFRKGYSSSYGLNAVYSTIRNLFCECRSLRIDYVRSKQNPADGPSRGAVASAPMTQAAGEGSIACSFSPPRTLHCLIPRVRDEEMKKQ